GRAEIERVLSAGMRQSSNGRLVRLDGILRRGRGYGFNVGWNPRNGHEFDLRWNVDLVQQEFIHLGVVLCHARAGEPCLELSTDGAPIKTYDPGQRGNCFLDRVDKVSGDTILQNFSNSTAPEGQHG